MQKTKAYLAALFFLLFCIELNSITKNGTAEKNESKCSSGKINGSENKRPEMTINKYLSLNIKYTHPAFQNYKFKNNKYLFLSIYIYYNILFLNLSIHN